MDETTLENRVAILTGANVANQAIIRALLINVAQERDKAIGLLEDLRQVVTGMLQQDSALIQSPEQFGLAVLAADSFFDSLQKHLAHERDHPDGSARN